MFRFLFLNESKGKTDRMSIRTIKSRGKIFSKRSSWQVVDWTGKWLFVSARKMPTSWKMATMYNCFMIKIPDVVIRKLKKLVRVYIFNILLWFKTFVRIVAGGYFQMFGHTLVMGFSYCFLFYWTCAPHGRMRCSISAWCRRVWHWSA